MPPDQSQLNAERLEALLGMLEDDGASPSGAAPDAQYLAALRGARELGQPAAVREAHANGKAPPMKGRRN